jgi:hypothetical protein
MQNKSICIVGACRDSETYLPAVLANLETIETWWRECKIVIFENDSVDNTNAIIRDWTTKGGHRTLITEYNLKTRIPNRVGRLAYIRNRLLEYIPNSFDYFMVLDLDDVFTHPVSKESFDSCFALDNWDVVTATGYTNYYDIWPLRVPGLIEFDCWKRYYELWRSGKYDQKTATYEAIEKYKDIMLTIKEPTVVNSAFNIAMLAKVSVLRRCCKYVGNNGPDEICEHVPFQNCLRSHGARIVFNPNFRL